MRTAALVALTVVSLMCAAVVPAVAKSAPLPPNNLGSTSPLVRYAYFTSVDLFPTELRRVTDFPTALKEFEAARESAVVFVGAIDSPGKDFTVTGVLRGPDNARVELFSEANKYSPDVKWHPVRRVISMNRLQPGTGGKWTLELQVDGQPVGSYGFEVAPDPALAPRDSRPTQIATSPPLGANPPPVSTRPGADPVPAPSRGFFGFLGGIKVEFTGPSRFQFRVDGKPYALDDKGRLEMSLSAGDHEVEAKGQGYRPLKETLKLVSERKLVQHKLSIQDAAPATIAVLEPAPGADPAITEDVRLKIEVKGESRVTAVRVTSGGRVIARVAPDAKLKPGEPVVVQSTLQLAEGSNHVTIEAEDENEKPSKQTIDIERERLIAVELKSQPFTRMVVNKKEFFTNQAGSLALRLLPGDYEIEASKTGYKRATERITIVRGQRAVERQITLLVPAPPSIALLDPAPGAEPVIGEEAKVKIEVRGESRLTAVRIVRDGRVIERLVPDSRYRAGQPWVVEPTLRGLGEGDNSFTVEAEDENGRPGKGTIVVARERLIPVEIRGDASGKVLVNGKDFYFGANGTLPLRLLPGEYEIEASKPGFKTYRQRLAVRRGQPAVTQQVVFQRPDPPSIALVDPKDGTEVNTPTPIIRVEVRSSERVASLKISGLQEVTERPKSTTARGEPWVAEAAVRLAQGPNDITLEAVDEHGQKTTKRVRLVYSTKVAVAPPQPPDTPATQRPSGDSQRPVAVSTAQYGRYHALIIGNSKYDTLASLNTPILDAQAVYDTLKRDYGFSNIRLLKNATRSEIVRALFNFRQTLTERDNLLIYYAGHGVLDADAERSYWLPVDASQDAPDTWLSTADITDALKAMKARHVMVVADSCYSGAMRDIEVLPRQVSDLERVAQRRARTLLASGGVEPVADSGGGKHSIFAKAFLDTLGETRGVTFVSSLFAEIKRKVTLNSDQTPLYSPIKLAGHEDGDFIFVRSAESGPRSSP